MAPRSHHRYVAEATAADGRPLGELVLSPDFAPAAEWSHLQGVRRGVLPARAHCGPSVVEPVYDGVRGAPYVAGIRVRFDACDPAHDGPEIPWSYFQTCVEDSARRLVERGAVSTLDSIRYRVCAFPASPAEAAPAEPVGAAPLVLERMALAPRLDGAARLGGSAWESADMPVLVPPAVLDEAAAMARAAGEQETGGVLVGHLRRDAAAPDVYAEVTAQIPAAGADAGPAHLGFTAETWSSVGDALALRGRGEVWLGWWHYHPFFCRRCEPSRRSRCGLSRPFFSRADCEVHRAVFDAAYSIAWLFTDVGEPALRFDCFGWRYGGIAPRGCHLLARAGARPATAYPEEETT